MSFTDFSKIDTVKSLNEFLADKSYIDGYVFSTFYYVMASQEKNMTALIL